MQETLRRTRSSILDAPLAALLNVNLEALLWAGIILFTLVTRFWDLGSRAYNHDESLHTLYSWYLYQGRGYIHDPMMHGPFQFHVNSLLFFLFGDTYYSGRMLPAIFGVIAVSLPPDEVGVTEHMTRIIRPTIIETSLAGVLQEDQLVVLESTTYPGTTREELLPILERGGLKAGTDFNLAFSPERVDPGNAKFQTKNIPKVVVRVRAIFEGAEAAKKRQLLGAEQRDLVDTIGSGQYCQQTQQQDLVQRVGHVTFLAWVRQIVEMTQENNRFVDCRIVVRRVEHGQEARLAILEVLVERAAGGPRQPHHVGDGRLPVAPLLDRLGHRGDQPLPVVGDFHRLRRAAARR